MADESDPVDRLIEMTLFAPIGLLAAAKEALPEWVERGRQQLSTQVPVARTIGELAVRHGTKQARQSLERLRRQADDLLGDATDTGEPAPPEREPPPPAGATAVPGADGSHDDEDALDIDIDIDEEWGRPPPAGTASPDAGELPIPGYDNLSASQVVQRLPGLSMEELDAVRSYELAGRARKTVLLRLAQLRAAS